MALEQQAVWSKLAELVPECRRLLPPPYGTGSDEDASLSENDYLLANHLARESLQEALADDSFEDEDLLDRWFRFLESLWGEDPESANLVVVGFLEPLRWFEPIPDRVSTHAGVMTLDAWHRLHPDQAG
jgi:hypothetical protein